jgi:tetratricopeptide (TPR) repeat protein
MRPALQLYDEACHLLAAGNLAAARAALDESLSRQPDQFEGQALRAYLQHQAGETEAAILSLTVACILGPARAHTHATLGRWQLQAGRPQEAIPPLERAARLAPADTQILYDLGLAYLRAGAFAAAAQALARVAARAPGAAHVATDLGLAHAGAGALDQAAAAFAAGYGIAPQDQGTWERCAAFLLDHDWPEDDALPLFTAAVLALQTRADWLLDRAFRDFREGRYATARRITTRLVALTPLSPLAANLHWFCLAQAEDVAAVRAFEPLIEPAFRAALPGRPGLRRNLAWYLHEHGDGAAALAEYEILAGAAMPADLAVQWAHVQLAYGAADQGWDGLARVAHARAAGGALPHWQGQAGAGIRLVITNPDGMGDFLNFCRYVPAAAMRCEVTLVLAPALHRVAATLCPGLTIVAPLTQVAADYYCSAAALPAVLHREMPLCSLAVPYLRAEAAATAGFAARLAAYAGLRVGICWQGSLTYNWDFKRSLAPARLAALAAIPGVTLFSLQVGRAAPDFMVDWTAGLHDYADTAALIAALDLVISVDTSVVHLAGGLGRPVWLLNFATSEWRWRLGRASPEQPTLWYPDNLREFRQPVFGDWPTVLAAVAAALEVAVASQADGQV